MEKPTNILYNEWYLGKIQFAMWGGTEIAYFFIAL